MCLVYNNNHTINDGDMMNIYDFDKTIYDGDSTIDFIKYCFRINKKTLFILPKFIFFLFLYLIKIIEKEKLKSELFRVVVYFDDIEKIVKNFWNYKEYKLKDFYMTKRKNTDIVISASPEFLLHPISEKYNFKLIATNVDTKTGKIIGKNCHGIEKVKRLKNEGINKCNNFYSDSLSDRPLSEISKKAYIVKGNKIMKWADYKENKIKKAFFNRDFITFIFIGIINVFNGIWIAYVYSTFIKNPVEAYILGFFTSMCISYFLNSKINFKEKMSSKKFILFSINNIPNFIIQVLSVVILIKVYNVAKLITYSISAVISVPLTFILLKINVFKNRS